METAADAGFWSMLLEAVQTTGLLFWMAFWAFVLGYSVSAIIQTLVTREQMSGVLGERGLKEVALSGFFGFVSSSCSFAALAAARTLFSKGATAGNAVAFLIATTNLVIELGLIIWVLIGWRFVMADYLLGIVMIGLAYALTRRLLTGRTEEEGREHARKLEEEELKHPAPETDWKGKLTSREGWETIAYKFVGEWRMALREVTVGFILAGIVSVFVPDSFWNAIFLEAGEAAPSFLAVLQHILIAPIMAFFTFVGSLGNVPLAAILWTKNMSFGGVLSFLGADLVAGTVIWLNMKYYGWRFALKLSGLLYVAMVGAALIVHYLFVALNMVPEARPANVAEMMGFSVQTHTFWLNVAFGIWGAVLLWIYWRASRRS